MGEHCVPGAGLGTPLKHGEAPGGAFSSRVSLARGRTRPPVCAVLRAASAGGCGSGCCVTRKIFWRECVEFQLDKPLK